MSMTLVLAMATAIALMGALAIFVRDLSFASESGRLRTVIEALLPLLALSALLCRSWTIL